MALVTPVAGRYSSTYDPPGATGASDLGIMQDGYRLRYRRHAQVINKTDAYGQTPIEALHQGAEVFLSGVGTEYGKAGLMAAIFPMSSTEFTATGTNSLKLGIIGIADSGRWATLILTSTATTPAASSPATLTGTSNVILAPQFDVELLFGPEHRLIPWMFQLFAYDLGSSVIGFFATT